MKTIWKYDLEIADIQIIHLPEEYCILSVANQNGTLCLWVGVTVPEDDPDSEMKAGLVPVQILIVGTGNEVSDEHTDAADFIGTVMFDSTTDPVIENAFVWHVFELGCDDQIGIMMEERETPSWSEYFLDMLPGIKRRSKDRSTQVGCIVVDDSNVPLSFGYNGFPRGVNDDINSRHERPLKYSWTAHSEANAVYSAARNGVKLLGSRMYVSIWPCDICAQAIIQAGIQVVICDGRGYYDNVESWSERWGEKIEIGLEMMREAGVRLSMWRPRGPYGYYINITHRNWKDKSHKVDRLE